jgi:hypothetical protein
MSVYLFAGALLCAGLATIYRNWIGCGRDADGNPPTIGPKGNGQWLFPRNKVFRPGSGCGGGH